MRRSKSRVLSAVGYWQRSTNYYGQRYPSEPGELSNGIRSECRTPHILSSRLHLHQRKLLPSVSCPPPLPNAVTDAPHSGFSLYNQEIIGQTPCYTVLATSLSVPAEISDQVSSLSAAIASTATNPNPTVSVHIISDQIFALSLPLKNGVETTHAPAGLSLGAKIGIGVGAGLGALIALILLVWFWLWRRRPNHNHHATPSEISAWTSNTAIAAGSTTQQPQQYRKSLASTVTAANVSPPWTSPTLGHTSYVDDEHVPGPGTEAWKPQPAQQYQRMPPPRTSLQPMPINAQLAPLPPGQSRYTELPAAEYVAPVEADGRETTGWAGVHQQQAQHTFGQAGYGQAYNQPGAGAGAGGGQGQEGGYAAYAPPIDRVELGGSTPRPPRWMQ
jgi:hypothetical protein